MSHKRSLAATLLLALLLPILAACGGGGGGGTNGTGSPAASAATTGAGGTGGAATTATADTGAAGGTTTTATAAETATTAAMAETATAGAGTTATDTAGGEVAELDLSALQVEDGATLRVSTWGNPSEQNLNKEQFERFNEIFPNVKIEYAPVADKFQDAMKADFAGGTNVDVLYIDSSLFSALAPNDQLLDLKPYMDQVGVKLDDFAGEMSQLFVLDDKVYGLPKDFNSLVLIVRNDFAEKAGIDPVSIKTWDDWKNAAAKMTTDGVIGQCIAFETERLGATWLQQGIEPIKDGKAQINDPKVTEAIQFFADLYKNKQATSFKEIGAGWCGEAMGQGKVAMVLEGGWTFPFMKETYPDVEYTAIPLPQPQGGQQATLVFTNAWGVAANTEYPNAAAALVLYLTSPQNQQAVLRTGFALPTRSSLLNDPYFQQNPNEKVVFEGGQYGKVSDLVWGGPFAKPDVVDRIAKTVLEPVFLSGADPNQVLGQGNQEVQGIIDSVQR